VEGGFPIAEAGPTTGDIVSAHTAESALRALAAAICRPGRPARSSRSALSGPTAVVADAQGRLAADSLHRVGEESRFYV
jgi:hypothetical protein